MAVAKAAGNPAAGGWHVYRFANDVPDWEGCGDPASPCFGDYPTLGQVR